MFKALLKKQFLALNTAYFTNRKTGQHRSVKGTVAVIVLYALLFVGLGGAFFALSNMLAAALVPAGLSWLYFALTGVLATLLGVFGSVFNTYASLYRAKDNDLLLAMPIPPSAILAVQMLGVFAMSLLYESLVFLPAVLAFYLHTALTPLRIILPLLMWLVLAVAVMLLTCLLGFVVARIAGKIKRKSVATTLLTLVFMAIFIPAYYYLCANLSKVLIYLTENLEQVAAFTRAKLYPFYLLGCASAGDALSALLFCAACAVLTAALWWLLSKTFLRTATYRAQPAKAVYREQPIKVAGVESALLRKEWRRFISSTLYVLNSALGTVMMPLAGVAALVFAGRLRPVLPLLPEGLPEVLIVAALLFLLSMNTITAPSVSLEGKNLWIVQHLPVPADAVLSAKLRLHLLMTAPPAVVMTVCLCIALQVEVIRAVLLVLLAVAAAFLSACFGLMTGLRHANLVWTNETVPIKQSVSVMFCIFGGWLLGIAVGVGGFFALRWLNGSVLLALLLAAIAAAGCLLRRWLHTRGARLFAQL